MYHLYHCCGCIGCITSMYHCRGCIGGVSLISLLWLYWMYHFYVPLPWLYWRCITGLRVVGVSLMWVLVYGTIFIYVYSLISFAFYRELFDGHTGLYCRTMYECMLTMFHMGPVRGLVNVRVPLGARQRVG